MLLILSFLFIFGLIIGSFIGMLTYRLPKGMSIFGRSVCDRCGGKIAWFENIPVLYFLLSNGRCGKCKNKISYRYPLIEIGTGFLFLLTYFFWDKSGSSLIIFFKHSLGLWSLVSLLFITSCFFSLFITDLEEKILPDSIMQVLLVGVIVFLLFLPSPTLLTNFFLAVLAASFFLFLYLVTSGRGMGFGDVKLVFVLGLLLGFPETIIFLFLSFITGALVGILLLLTGKASFGRPIPFGPFILFSAWFTLFFSDKIMVFYFLNLH